MSPRSKKEYLAEIYTRYKHASRKDKATMLDEFCIVCGYKHAIRLLRTYKRFTKPKYKRKGNAPVYTIKTSLKRIWLAANRPRSKRLKVILPLWLTGYMEHFVNLSPET